MLSYPVVNYSELPPIRVRNTMGNKLELFEPLKPGLVRMYVCGPTVYDYMHLGHARTYVAFDSIKRYLQLRGYDVVHVQNITDIDDKIIDRARREGRDWREVVDEFSRDYFDMLKSLNITVDIHPRVTEHVSDIIEFIEGLIEKGYAYVAPSGSVYFDVDAYPEYGRLSGRFHAEEWRQEEDVLKEKKHPYDFALWKAWKPGEPYWESPWGRGRPGWHIECSVMSSKYLGNQFDIHAGGQDLIFPHHENERAQSEAFFGAKPWVKYWLHTGYLTIRGEKMSKSLGNIVTVREALKKWGPRVLRFWLLSVHYRSQLDFNEEALEQSRATLKRIETAYNDLINIVSTSEPESNLSDEKIRVLNEIYSSYIEFHKSLSTDFNTAKALSAVMSVVHLVNNKIVPWGSYTLAVAALRLFREFNQVYSVLEEGKGFKVEGELVGKLVDLIVKIRAELRSRKEYDLADSIRTELATLGIRLYDHPGGKTVWRIESP